MKFRRGPKKKIWIQPAEHKVRAKATYYVIFTCIVSAMSGALFGFDGGITGGVSTMPAFQARFFPEHLSRVKVHDTYYCKYNDQILQVFATSMYFTGACAAIPGAMLSRRFGRTMTMTLAGTAFIIGAAIQSGAPRTINLILGRIFLGIGVGFADQASTIYSSELAPPHLRGTLTMLFQLCVVTGILVAQCVNVATYQLGRWGWRLSLGLTAVPGLVLLIGGLLLPETPNSLIERGYLQRGRAVLEAIRGTSEVDEEFSTIVMAYRREKAAGDNQFKSIIRRDRRPHLVMSIALPFFQQFSGVNAVVFYTPFLFPGLGNKFRGAKGALLASVCVGAVQVFGTILGVFMVDRIGRRKILIQASIQTFVSELALAIVFAVSVDSDTVHLGDLPAIAAVALTCTFVLAFGWGWGPLAWVLTSEIQPLETRALGQGITVFTQLLCGGVVGQFFLSALCRLQYGVYLIFTVVQLFAILFVYYFLPETRGIPIEMVSEVFKVHWFWKRYNMNDAESEALEREMQEILAKRKKQGGIAEEVQGLQEQLRPGAAEGTGRQGVFDSSRSVLQMAGQEGLEGVPEEVEDASDVGLGNALPPIADIGPRSPFDKAS